MVIHDEEGAAALHVLVSPLRSERTDLGLPGSRTAAVVFLSQPGRREMVPADVLQVLHGLTPAEARLAAELAEGLSLEEIAARHDLSKGTLRNHLKAVFAKTGIHRQVELVRLVLNSPTAMLRAG